MSIFTRRHYLWLTCTARRMRREGRYSAQVQEAVDSAIGELAQSLSEESPGFDKDRFWDAIRQPDSRNPAP